MAGEIRAAAEKAREERKALLKDILKDVATTLVKVDGVKLVGDPDLTPENINGFLPLDGLDVSVGDAGSYSTYWSSNRGESGIYLRPAREFRNGMGFTNSKLKTVHFSSIDKIERNVLGKVREYLAVIAQARKDRAASLEAAKVTLNKTAARLKPLIERIDVLGTHEKIGRDMVAVEENYKHLKLTFKGLEDDEAMFLIESLASYRNSVVGTARRSVREAQKAGV